MHPAITPKDAFKIALLAPAVAVTAPLAFGGVLLFVAMLSVGSARSASR